MVPFHIWLPQAHVEAPVAGSVLLAGVLLKLGGYGFLRLCLPLLPDASKFFTPAIVTLSLVAIVYGSLTTCRQIDMKRLIAYSSVAHMGLITLAIFSGEIEGLIAIPYGRTGTRLIKYYRGLTVSMPLFAILFMLFTLANIALPLSCNFIGEFYALIAAFKLSKLLGALASTGIILSAAYSLLLFNKICFGSPSPYNYFIRDISRREINTLTALVFFIYFLGIYPKLITSYIAPELIINYAN